MTASS
jgi:serine/threonine protein kinase